MEIKFVKRENKKRNKEERKGGRKGKDWRGELMANPNWSVITGLIPLAQAINELLLLFTKDDICVSHK